MMARAGKGSLHKYGIRAWYSKAVPDHFFKRERFALSTPSLPRVDGRLSTIVLKLTSQQQPEKGGWAARSTVRPLLKMEEREDDAGRYSDSISSCEIFPTGLGWQMKSGVEELVCAKYVYLSAFGGVAP
jgi:hypothetical protein